MHLFPSYPGTDCPEKSRDAYKNCTLEVDPHGTLARLHECTKVATIWPATRITPLTEEEKSHMQDEGKSKERKEKFRKVPIGMV